MVTDVTTRVQHFDVWQNQLYLCDYKTFLNLLCHEYFLCAQFQVISFNKRGDLTELKMLYPGCDASDHSFAYQTNRSFSKTKKDKEKL